MAKWRFAKRDRGSKERNPPLEWFFNLDVMDNASEPLVREGIQNSLDARSGKDPVRIRFYLSEASGAVSQQDISPFMLGLEAHLTAKDNGLKAAPQLSEPCAFLVFEDFGTTGLEGDPDQHLVPEGEDNAFYHFFRAEGASNKGKDKLGRFGIGKFAFPLCSRARAILALTKRKDGREFMAGVATLKCHSVGGTAYQPDGWFGEFAEDAFQLPLEEDDALCRFKKTFCLERDGQPGLSVVVPYYSPDNVVATDVVRAVMKHFFLPVVKGELVVEVVRPNERHSVTADTVDEALDWLEVSAQGDQRKLKDLAELKALVRLAQVSARLPEPDIELPPPIRGRALKWQSGCMDQDDRDRLARKLKDNQIIIARFPLSVLARSGTQQSSFDVFIQQDPTGRYAKPAFVRKGNVIAAVGKRVKGYRAIVSVPDGPLSHALGKAENVAHTEWRRDSEDLKSAYKYSASHIEYVVGSVSNLLREIYATDDEVDFNALADLFPDCTSVNSGLGKKPKFSKKKGRKPANPSPPPPPTPKRYRITKAPEGFTVGRGAPEAPMPGRMLIRAAYAVRRGNPMSRFHPADFDLTKRRLCIEVEGAHADATAPNVLEVTQIEGDFKVTVTGFDKNRDLFVEVKVVD